MDEKMDSPFLKKLKELKKDFSDRKKGRGQGEKETDKDHIT